MPLSRSAKLNHFNLHAKMVMRTGCHSIQWNDYPRIKSCYAAWRCHHFPPRGFDTLTPKICLGMVIYRFICYLVIFHTRQGDHSSSASGTVGWFQSIFLSAHIAFPFHMATWHALHVVPGWKKHIVSSIIVSSEADTIYKGTVIIWCILTHWLLSGT